MSDLPLPSQRLRPPTPGAKYDCQLAVDASWAEDPSPFEFCTGKSAAVISAPGMVQRITKFIEVLPLAAETLMGPESFGSFLNSNLVGLDFVNSF